MKLIATQTHLLLLMAMGLITMMWTNTFAMPTMVGRAIAVSANASGSPQLGSAHDSAAFGYKIADLIQVLEHHVAVIKAGADELDAMKTVTATRAVDDDGVGLAKDDYDALLAREDAEQAKLESRLHIHWHKVWATLGDCVDCGACGWTEDGSSGGCKTTCSSCFKGDNGTAQAAAAADKNSATVIAREEDAGALEGRFPLHFGAVLHKLGACMNCGSCGWGGEDRDSPYCKSNCQKCTSSGEHSTK